MRPQDVVAILARESGQNSPGEFVIAAVDRDGRLRQFGGVDGDIAAELLGIIEEGCALVTRAPGSEMREIMAAQAEGEVPEQMPRNIVERYGPAPGAGIGEKPQGLGQRPVTEPTSSGEGDALPGE